MHDHQEGCLERSIHHYRNVNNYQKNLYDILALGPVRMFAAGKSIESRNIPKRQAVQIDSSLLSELVKISVGEVNPNDILLYDSRSAVLEMLTEEGYIPNGVEFRSTLTQLLGAATTAFAGTQISRPISDRPLSVESLALLNGWLAECCTSHTMYRPELSLGNMPHRLPMRLVDVSFDKTGRVRLIETKRLGLRHVALSYCWGVDHAGQKITASTIAQVKQGIHPRKLTRTIQDAITLVRVLDIRYLWVDALCMIQGDETDWQREASMMRMIYANADFTVAATRAEGSSDGFLQTREEHTVALKLPSSAATVFFRESLDAAGENLKQVGHSPLLARAWVMQERMLSRRTVDFTAKKIFLTCRQGIIAEDGVKTTYHETLTSNFTKILNLLPKISLTGSALDIWTGQFFGVWAELTQWYTTREITCVKDRLPAIDGIASLASLVLPGRYICGLWEINLADGLFWQPLHRPIKPESNENAPSWSWASAVSEVTLSGHNPHESLLEFVGLSDCQKVLTIRGSVQECQVSFVANPPEPSCRSDRKLRDPPIPKLWWYTFYLRSAVGPRAVGSTLNNVCMFDGVRGDHIDLHYVDLLVSRSGRITWRGLLLRKLESA
jgi:hypothetical protein